MNPSGDVGVVAPVNHRPRVLIVEDSEAIRALLTIWLNRRGYDVIAVADGQEALDAARTGVDLVLLDLGLPGINGLEVCRRLRAEPGTASLPIIMLTGRNHPDDVRDGLRAGADDFLTKPVEERELSAALERLAQASRGVPTLPNEPRRA